MPTINPEKIIGIRIPKLRAFANELAKENDNHEFLDKLPHTYYEENNLHAFLIEKIKDFDNCIAALDTFLPFVDNWATCDSMRPKVLGKHCEKLLPKAKQWISSTHTYTIRFGIGTLMNFYLDKNFKPEYLEIVSKIKSSEYYVNMMIAWFFATALAKQYDATLPYLQKQKLSSWCHNKTIQKAIESYRITPEQKELLRKLKI
jgi:3-methyladenine DNA glycosylase AlkD